MFQPWKANDGANNSEVTSVSDTLRDLFPDEIPLQLDEERILKLRVQGLKYLEKRYGSTEAFREVLLYLEADQGRVYSDLPHFVYACLLRPGDKSPLTVEQLEQLVDDGADINAWLGPTSQAVTNFFLHRIWGNAAKASLGAPGPGNGPIT